MNLKHLVFLLLLFVCVNLSAQTKEKADYYQFLEHTTV